MSLEYTERKIVKYELYCDGCGCCMPADFDIAYLDEALNENDWIRVLRFGKWVYFCDDCKKR